MPLLYYRYVMLVLVLLIAASIYNGKTMVRPTKPSRALGWFYERKVPRFNAQVFGIIFVVLGLYIRYPLYLLSAHLLIKATIYYG